jgi:uncharacterized protein YggE
MNTFRNLVTGIAFGALACALVLGGQARALAAPWPPAQPVQPAALAAGDDTCDTGRTVQVSGSATVNVVPDRVSIKLGVQTNAATPEGAEAGNRAAIQSVIEAVRKLGVEDRDIATDYYLVYPLYDDYDSMHITGYRVYNVVAITLRDASRAGDVLIAAFNAGANQVDDVQFYTSELRKYRDQARALAVQAAREKAQALAEAGGAQAGCVLNISENTWSYYSGGWWGHSNATQWAQNVVQNAPSTQQTAPAGDTPVSLGQIAVSAEVAASFALR